MKQFDIVELVGKSLAILLQADLLDATTTCVVAPMIRVDAVMPAARLHPRLRVGRREYVVLTEKLSAVLRNDLVRAVASAKDREWDLRRALDIVCIGV
jgi:hypothetical protein